MKIRIIDLLNKIANGEEVPKKIKFDSQIWQKENGGRNNIYYVNDINYDLFVIVFRSNGTYSINDEVEIIEEDKKIELCMNYEYKKNIDNVEKDMKTLVKKINELIDVIKDLKGSDE